jgi:hypothetical protein
LTNAVQEWEIIEEYLSEKLYLCQILEVDGTMEIHMKGSCKELKRKSKNRQSLLEKAILVILQTPIYIWIILHLQDLLG